MNTKICHKCHQEKTLDNFYKCSRCSDGYQWICKECMRTSYNECRKSKIEHYNEVRKTRQIKNTQRIREWKSARGCCICGENYANCLELHHLDPSEKEFNPSEMYTFGWDSFMKEASKCVILCANCHRKVHGGIIDLDKVLAA